MVRAVIVREMDGGVEISVRARPRAQSSEIAGPYGDRAVRIRLAAPPVDGEANHELVELLADVFDVPRRRVELVRGAGSRSKVVRILGVGREDAVARLGL